MTATMAEESWSLSMAGLLWAEHPRPARGGRPKRGRDQRDERDESHTVSRVVFPRKRVRPPRRRSGGCDSAVPPLFHVSLGHEGGGEESCFPSGERDGRHGAARPIA